MKDILESCDYYVDLHVWNLEPRVNPRLWLQNFTAEELPYAQELLASFFLLNEKMCKSILKGAFQKISTVALKKTGVARQVEWENFLEGAIFTTVDTQETNPTASGNLICRWAHSELKIPEALIVSNAEALNRLYKDAASTVIFLDDFVGSGMQFSDTWTFPHTIEGKILSFPGICTGEKRAFYIPIVATSYGLGEIEKTCKNVTVLPGNVLDERYSAFHKESIVWSDDLKKGAIKFLEKVNKRAGIEKKQWRGFHKLGLTLAFGHSVPDAMLPIFWWKENGWKPLIERH